VGRSGAERPPAPAEAQADSTGSGVELFAPRPPRTGREEAAWAGLSFRGLAVGLVAIVAVCVIVSWAELVTGQIMIGFLQIPPVAVAGLFALVLANKIAGRISARLALRSHELAVVYVMMLIAAMVSSRGLMEDLLPTLVGVDYYANPGNRWEELFFPYIKPWMVPWDPSGGLAQFPAAAFYEGLRSGERIPWASWARPLAIWLILVASVYLAFLCIATIIRRQWSDNEKLAYPLVQLPVEMVRDNPAGSFFRNPLTWIGFAIPTVIFGINGIHNWDPSLPSITVDVDINSFFTHRPWSDITFFHAYLSPGAVGFFYLLPLELLLSFWVFHLVTKLEDLIVSALAFPPIQSPHGSGNGYVDYQTAGAYIVLVVYLVGIALPHLRGVFRRAVANDAPTGRDELLPYRAAVWGLGIAIVGALIWLRQAGMAVGVGLFYLLIYLFVQAIIMARGCTEAGLPMSEGSFTPMDISSLLASPAALGPRNLTVLAFFDAMFTRDLRGLLLTGFLDAQRIGDEVRLVRRKLLSVFVISLAVVIPVAVVIQLWLPYHIGALSMYSFSYRGNNIQFFRENAAFLLGESRYNSGAPVAFIVGGLVTAALGVLRVRYVGWPLHPLAYALSTSWTVMVFWFPMFVAWVIKWAVVHYGGMRLYARIRPLFLGLIFGEFTAAVFWTLIAMFTDIPAPFFPWP
jgi:hypothetical protein